MKDGCMRKGILERGLRAGISLIFLCLALVSFALAETISTSSQGKNYSTAELDQMLAPIALYPDGLLIQIMMASTYPGEVAEAGRWQNANPNLNGEAAIRAARSFDWNISVKSLLAFPDVLSMMSSHMDWTVSVGNAFKTQREEVMDRIQYLRRKAKAAGHLMSDERMKVITEGDNIAIEPISARVVYVPYYNPSVVYGSWWWPGYAPYYWAPWHGYLYYPGYVSGGIIWGPGIGFSYTRFYGRADWNRRYVHWNPRPQHDGSKQLTPGYKRYSREEIMQRGPSAASSRQRSVGHPPSNRSPSAEQPSSGMSHDHSSARRPTGDSGHAQPPSRPSPSTGRLPTEGSAEKPAARPPSSPVASRPENASRPSVSRPNVSRSESVSHPAASRRSDDTSSQGEGRSGRR